jgi:hypothetical protein
MFTGCHISPLETQAANGLFDPVIKFEQHPRGCRADKRGRSPGTMTIATRIDHLGLFSFTKVFDLYLNFVKIYSTTL